MTRTVAITDYTFPTLEIEEQILQPQGVSVIGGQCKTEDALISLVHQADAVITQFARINARVIAAMHRARVIVRYGIGVDNVDLDAAREKGIPVCNVPDYCVDEVADHTLAFILASTRQIVPNALLIRDGKWGLATSLNEMRTLRDVVVGIIGFGRIGREVASRLAPFKCHRLVFDPGITPETIVQSGCEPVTLEDLLPRSDIVTLHCPSTPKTKKLLNSQTISKMKPGTIVINLARGDLIDTPSLHSALESGHVSAAALDVCDVEPIPMDSPLRSMSQVIASSHIASASPKAVRTLRETAANIVVKALSGVPLPNIVNGVTPTSIPGESS